MNIETNTTATATPFSDKKLYELEELLHLVATDSYFSLLKRTLDAYAQETVRGSDNE